MAKGRQSSVQRVRAALAQMGLGCDVVELPDSTRTAREAAQAIGCEVAQIVKSLVFRGRESGKAILVAASGVNRVNEEAVAASAGEPIEKADAGFVRERTGFAIGGVPPLAHATPLEAFVDADLLRFEDIWAAAGSPHAVFRLTPEQLQRMTGGQVIAIG